MHNWSSMQKLLEEFENPKIENPFEYEDFSFQREEFDNVPPVVPRFQFYIQARIRPLVEYLNLLKKSMTVYELKDETQKNFKKNDVMVNTMEIRLKEQIESLNQRCENLQAQIDKSNQEKAAEREIADKKAKESLLGKDDFDFSADGLTIDAAHEEILSLKR